MSSPDFLSQFLLQAVFSALPHRRFASKPSLRFLCSRLRTKIPEPKPSNPCRKISLMPMPTVALQQVTNPFARRNAKGTLEKPIQLKHIQQFLVDAEVRQTFELVCVNGIVSIWGAKLERFSQMLKMFPRQCLFLFRQGAHVNRVGVLCESI